MNRTPQDAENRERESTPQRRSTIFAQAFDNLAKTLTQQYEGSSFRTTADNRTCSNREWLVAEFCRKVAPIAVESRLGAVVVDSIGGQSRDVDVLLLSPWASPVWPHLHGIVPVEGVLFAIFVERMWTPQSEVWRQVHSVRNLWKRLTSADDYAKSSDSKDVVRNFRPDAGVWFWGRGPGESNEECATELYKAIIESANQPSEREAVNDCWRRAEEMNWTPPTDSLPQHYDFRKGFRERLEEGAITAPSMVYFHEKQMLFVRFSQRNPDEPLNARNASLFATEVDGLVIEIQESTNKVRPLYCKDWDEAEGMTYKWGLALYKGARALPAFALYLSFCYDRFGRERTDYGAYLQLTTPLGA